MSIDIDNIAQVAAEFGVTLEKGKWYSLGFDRTGDVFELDETSREFIKEYAQIGKCESTEIVGIGTYYWKGDGGYLAVKH